MRLHLACDIPCDFARAVAEVKRPRLLAYIARPLVFFLPLDSAPLPEVWHEQIYWFRLRLFGFLPFGKQAVCPTITEDAERFTLYDKGYSALIKQWDHRIEITAGQQDCRYSDTVDLDAGLLTPLIWLFARVFFAHRQARWRKLARANFDYGQA